MKVGACSRPQGDRETPAPAPFVLGQTVRRLSYGLEPWLNRTTAAPRRSVANLAAPQNSSLSRLERCSSASLQRSAGTRRAMSPWPKRSSGQSAVSDRLDAGLDQRLVPGPRGPHVGEVAHHLPAVEAGVVDEDRRLAGAGSRAPPAWKPVPEAPSQWPGELALVDRDRRGRAAGASSTGAGAPVSRSKPEAVFGKAITSRIVSAPLRRWTMRSTP